MNASEHKNTFFEKISNFEFQRKIQMPFSPFEFLEQFVISTFLITLTQFEKTGEKGKVFIPLEI